MTNSQIMTEAHKIAKQLTGNYAARMSFALKMAYQKAKIVTKAIKLRTEIIVNSVSALNCLSLEMRLAGYMVARINRRETTMIQGIDTFKHLVKSFI